VRTLKHQFIHYTPYKLVLVIFRNQNHFKHNSCFLHLLFGSDIYRQQATTFSTLAGVGIQYEFKVFHYR
jgi:hypothetical protein